jgi:hypothetical protein
MKTYIKAMRIPVEFSADLAVILLVTHFNIIRTAKSVSYSQILPFRFSDFAL